MGYANYFDVARAWVRRCQSTNYVKIPNNPRMPVTGDRIYSYGSHFEIGRGIRNKRGELTFFLLNGDNYSVTTARHQSEVRAAVQRSGVPYVIIPYEALTAAGISDLNTVSLLEATTATPQEDGTYVYTWETRRHWLGESLIEATVTWSRQHTCRTCKGTGVSPDAPEIPADPDHVGHWPKIADYPDTDEGRAALAVADREHERAWHAQRRLRDDWRSQWAGTCPNKACRGRGQWTTTHKRRAKFLSGFDHNETRRCYFFCELPRTSETTVAGAYDALKPAVVSFAERNGRDVRRQGDIFAIETTFTTRDLRQRGATFSKRTHLIGTNHTATQVATLPDGTTFARGCLYHEPERRRPDHSRIKVPSGWSLIAKNTVPVTKR